MPAVVIPVIEFVGDEEQVPALHQGSSCGAVVEMSGGTGEKDAVEAEEESERWYSGRHGLKYIFLRMRRFVRCWWWCGWRWLRSRSGGIQQGRIGRPETGGTAHVVRLDWRSGYP